MFPALTHVLGLNMNEGSAAAAASQPVYVDGIRILYIVLRYLCGSAHVWAHSSFIAGPECFTIKIMHVITAKGSQPKATNDGDGDARQPQHLQKTP